VVSVAGPDTLGSDVLRIRPAAVLLAPEPLERRGTRIGARFPVVLPGRPRPVRDPRASRDHRPGLEGVAEHVAELVGEELVLHGELVLRLLQDRQSPFAPLQLGDYNFCTLERFVCCFYATPEIRAHTGPGRQRYISPRYLWKTFPEEKLIIVSAPALPRSRILYPV
jgi:hypothetical protein